jgi:hypothetical protein
MPALGLLLEHPLFDNYNRKVAGLNAALPGPDAPEWRAPLDFEAHRAAIDAFKQAFIYGSMRAIEDKTGLFDAWVRHLDKYTGDDLNWVGLHTGLLLRRSAWGLHFSAAVRAGLDPGLGGPHAGHAPGEPLPREAPVRYDGLHPAGRLAQGRQLPGGRGLGGRGLGGRGGEDGQEDAGRDGGLIASHGVHCTVLWSRSIEI